MRAGERSLLVEIAENGVGMLAGGDADFGMIAVGLADAIESDGFSLPRSGGCDFDRAGQAERLIPTRDRSGGGGGGNFGSSPLGGGAQWLAAEHRGNHLPRRDVQAGRF